VVKTARRVQKGIKFRSKARKKYQKPVKKRIAHLTKRRKNGLGASAKRVFGPARRKKRLILPSGVY
jgi:hypothetical protein